MGNRVTQKQIAEKVGVSIGTVDRALNNRGRINEETKEQIIKVAKELNYKPNNIARQLVLGKSIKIAAVFPDKPERFFGKMINGMKAATEELQDFGVNVEFLHTESLNPVIEKEVLSSINPDDYDGIVIAAGGESIRKYIDDFVDGGTPVVTFNADVKSSKRLFFVGQDSYRAGRIGAELMGKFLTGEGFTAVLTGFKDVQSHQERFQGFFDCMSAHYSKIDLAGPFEYYDDDETAYEITKQILTKHPNINGFFATSGPGAVGAGKAVKEKMPDKKIRVIGLDVNDETVALMREGFCSAIIFQDPFMQAYYAVKFLTRNIMDGWLPPKHNMHIRSKIVLRENIDEYRMRDDEQSLLDIIIE